MSADLRPKALGVLRSGRLTVLHSTCRLVAHRVDEVIAKVRSSREGGGTYCVDLDAGRWTCTCPGWQQRNECTHVLAVQLVTGHAAVVTS